MSITKKQQSWALLMIVFMLALPLHASLVFASSANMLFVEGITQSPVTSSFAGIRLAQISAQESVIHNKNSFTSLFALQQVKAYGGDNVESARRKDNDFVVLKAIVNEPTQVQPAQLWLGSSRSFDTCEQPTGSSYE